MHFEIVGEIEHVETMAVGGRIRDIMKNLNMVTTEARYSFCVRNDECEDLEVRKVYQILPDREAAREGYVRVVDESGEDYLYPESYFVPVKLPQRAQHAVLATA